LGKYLLGQKTWEEGETPIAERGRWFNALSISKKKMSSSIINSNVTLRNNPAEMKH
jgi:tryptophanyl-tRNA synthetase